VIGMLPDGYEKLRTAPDHVVDTILALMPAGPDPGGVDRARARRAEARAYANRIWAEAAHVGAAWGISRAPLKLEIDLSAMPALGDLIRQTPGE
jgi:hypothetical protein